MTESLRRKMPLNSKKTGASGSGSGFLMASVGFGPKVCTDELVFPGRRKTKLIQVGENGLGVDCGNFFSCAWGFMKDDLEDEHLLFMD